MIRTSMLTMTFAVLGIACAPVLLAGAPETLSAAERIQSESEPSSPSYSENELRSFAVALLEIEKIKSSYAPKLEQNLREQAQVKQAATLELMLALRKNGMSVDKYQEMLASVQSNPDLAGKVNEYLKQSGVANSSGKESNGGRDSNGDKSEKPGASKSVPGAELKQRVEEL
jgi:hypothetical protein